MAEADVPQPNTPYIEPGHYKEAVILCSGGYDHSIRYWNAEKGFCERIVQQPDNSHINSLAITPNREILASAGFQHIRLYDIESGNQNPLVNFEGLTKNVCTVGFNHLGNWLYTGGEDGYVRIWDVRNRALHCQRQRQFQTPVNAAFLHPNGVEIYVADQSGSIYIWNLQTETLQRLFVTSDGYIQHLSYDKDSRLLAAVDTRGNCYVFRNTPKFFPANMDEKSGEMTKSGFLQRRLMFQAHSKYILKCAFSPDSTLLATASGDQTVKLWSTSDFSVANPTSVVQFDDPFETVTGGGAETGPASMASSGSGSTTTTFKNAYSIDSEMSETMDASMLSNPSAAFLQAPYLVGLFSANQIQQPRPPPCYLRPKKLCEKCQLAGRAGQIAALDPRVPPTSGSSTSAPDPAAIAGGRSLFHSHGCKQAYPTGHSSLAGVIPMQPTLNSLNQLTWNFYGAKSPGSGGAGKKMSDPGLCNHYSHFRSPVHRASVAGMLPEEGGYAKSNLTSPGKNAATSTATTAPSLPSAPSNAYFGATARRLPAYAMRFFDNKYYELHSGVLNTDSEEEEGEAELPLEVRTRRRAEREERKKARKSAEQQEAEEDEEFYRLMKAMRLIEESDDSEDEDEDDDEEDEEEDSDEDEEDEEEETGLRMRSDFIGRKGRAEARKAATAAAKAKKNGQKAAKNGLICCTQCGTCYCSEKANIEAQQAEAAAAAAGSATSGTRSRRPSGNPNATGSQPTGGKNEWAYTNAITPKVTLSTPNQRWVWDVAFTYDSQFIFTASSDQYVRLWSVFTGELTREYSGHQKSVTALGFSDMLKDQPIVG